ncbi:sugar-specific transcriptional regulator TrmB [uncultured Methanoregula sp.]|uniref:sugar-specific transcriptional regulator TrmB n=1 Tax=uncultured Methanoregula sp. TaxID=1005933 RepID=UPI0037478394
MSSVLEHRRDYLRLMRQFTIDKGFFTVNDIHHAAGIPRSTAQDWVYRLQNEGCVLLKEEKRGRNAARYAAISAMPASTCRRIFTTVDGDQVAIYHECMSSACAAFCGYHHALAGGILYHVERDGTLLMETAFLGEREIAVGLAPLSAVGVCSVERQGDAIIQTIRCIGGPAYSLSGMMARAEGVLRVEPRHIDHIVEGKVWTSACMQVIIGVDDTDTRDGGATFALALALLNHLSGIKGIIPISHHVVMLNPDIFRKTAGNSASYIEIAILPERFFDLAGQVRRFVSDESFSVEWGIAIRAGFRPFKGLQEYGRLVREQVITRAVAEATAEQFGIMLIGGNGVIGALGAVALAGIPYEIQLDPAKNDFPELC